MEYKIKNKFRLIGIRKRRFCLCAVLISVLGLMLMFQAIPVTAQPAIPTTTPIEGNGNGNGNETTEPSETTPPLPTLPPLETNDTAQPTLPPIPSEIAPLTPTPTVTPGTPTATTPTLTPTQIPTAPPPAAIPGFGISSVVIAVMSVFVLSVVKRKRKR
jgi:hypothetical protein